MAKTNGPLFSSEARGGVGGIVHNTYRGLHTVKAKTAPHQSCSPRALQQRALSIDLSRAWANCQFKEEWNQYAAEHPTTDFAGEIRPSGANCFVALNLHILLLAIAPLIDRPPTAPSPPPVNILGVSLLPPSTVLFWDSPLIPQLDLDVWLEGPRSKGRISNLNNASHNGYTDSVEGFFGISYLLPGAYTFYIRSVGSHTGLTSGFTSIDFTIPEEA